MLTLAFYIALSPHQREHLRVVHTNQGAEYPPMELLSQVGFRHLALTPCPSRIPVRRCLERRSMQQNAHLVE